MPDSPPALRPPEKWRHLKWHWVIPHNNYDAAQSSDIPCVVEWHSDPDPEWARQDRWLMRSGSMEAEGAAYLGWRYHGPCDPAAIVPDPDNERQRDAVADAMKQACFASSWDEQARAVLTALRDMK